MKEVAKARFKELYFSHGGGDRAGYGQAYWDQFFSDEKTKGMTFKAEEPACEHKKRMMLVSDFAANEFRMFFLSEEEEDSAMRFPGSEND